MTFNCDPSKQAQEVIFSLKTSPISQTLLTFNSKCSEEQHLKNIWKCFGQNIKLK